MNFKTVTYLCFAFVLIGSLLGISTSSSLMAPAKPASTAEAEELDESIRQNPVIEGSDEDIDIDVPDFINQEINNIQLNGADWSKAFAALGKVRKSPFSIVQIGDSHIQADISSGAMREFLQYDYGNAGRGLVIPFRMARTNEPWDYKISSESPWNSAKLLSRPWSLPMGFTGISVSPTSPNNNLTISTRDDGNYDYNPFNNLTLYHSGQIHIKTITDAEGKPIKFSQTPVDGGTLVKLSSDVNSVTLDFESDNLVLHGAYLSGNRPGLFYNTIGNNGASFAHYNNIENFGKGVSLLHPNLIIISLGTNDAFGTLSVQSLERQIHSLVTDIKKSNPDAALLLVTPMECRKSAGTKVQRVGKRTRRVSGGHVVNSNVALVRDVIKKYAEQHNIALYDWYEVAGGTGASAKWIEKDLYGSDKVHHTARGYRLNGYLMYQALINLINSSSNK